MSQSALTQALRKLETTAGSRLFERSGFGVTATAAGQRLVHRSRRARRLLGEAGLHRNVTAAQLRTLAAVVETGGYSTAARRLDVAQPTVHRAAKEVELIAGVELFRRASRGVEPTEAARTLARTAGLVLAEIRQGLEEVRELQGDTASRVAIGCLPLARSEFLPQAVTMLLENCPDARISILDGPYVEQLHALRYGEIDWLIGALRDPPPVRDVRQEALFSEPLAVVVRPGHPLLGSERPSVYEMARLEWVAPRTLAPTRRFFDSFFKQGGTGVAPRVIECSSLIATRGLLQRSDRAAMLSPMQVREDVMAGELAILVDSIPGSSRWIGTTTRDNWEPTTVQARFGEILRSLARRGGGPGYSNRSKGNPT